MSTDIAIQKHLPGGSERQKIEVAELLFYWRSVAKRKWIILAVALAISVLAGLVALTIRPVYRATATVMIEQNKAKVVSIEEVYSGVGANREHFETQADLLASRSLASRVIQQLNLAAHPEFDPRQHKPPFWRRMLNERGITSEKATDEKQIHAAVLDQFMQRTTIEPGRLTQLIHVSFDATDPELAAEIANAIVDGYIESNVETSHRITKRATGWLNERLSGLRKTLEESERALQQYRERERLVDTRGLAQSGAGRQIEDLTRALVEVRQKRAEAETAYNQIKTAADNLETLPVIQRNPMMPRLKEAEADAERKVAELARRYGPEHVRMIQAHSELTQARENTRRQVQTIAASLANEYQAARANEKALERSMAEAKGSVQTINRKEFQLGALERAVATNRQLYETFVNRLKETNAASDAQASPIARVADPAVPPQEPIKPKKRQIVMIAFLLAIFFGVMVAILLEHLDKSVNTADDVEEKLRQPMLAMLPLLSHEPAKYIGRHFVAEPRSAFSEGIRTIRTGVLLSSMNESKKSLLVTSSVPGEGKSAVALNLALAHAQSHRVLLIDADLRHPSVSSNLGLDDTKPGLTDLVSGSANFASCLQRVDGASLYAIAAGPLPADPLELILSSRFQQLLKALSGACDMLIIDSPPVHLVSDAVVLSKMATGVVFVVKADSTPDHVVRRSIRALQSVDANLLGVVLNQLDFGKADRYYGAYTRGYSDYYARAETSLGNPKPAAAGYAATPRKAAKTLPALRS